MISAEEIKALMAKDDVENELESTLNVHGGAFNSGDYTYEDYQFVSSGIQNLAAVANKRAEIISTLQKLLNQAAEAGRELLNHSGNIYSGTAKNKAIEKLLQTLAAIEPYLTKEGE